MRGRRSRKRRRRRRRRRRRNLQAPHLKNDITRHSLVFTLFMTTIAHCQ
jgi:hypothetical protein